MADAGSSAITRKAFTNGSMSCVTNSRVPAPKDSAKIWSSFDRETVGYSRASCRCPAGRQERPAALSNLPPELAPPGRQRM